jgi:hypothetical protein
VKIICLSLLLISHAQANDFFGIPILGEPKDQMHAMIHQLMEGDYKKARGYLEQLKKSSPAVAGSLKLGDLTLPCQDDEGEPNPACPACEGRGKVVDAHALRYLQYKLDSGLEEMLALKAAWKMAFEAFSVRRAAVPAREVFQGRVVKVEENAFVARDEEGRSVYLMGVVTDGYGPGDPLVCYVWPMSDRMHPFKRADGTLEELAVYTLNLWWDY